MKSGPNVELEVGTRVAPWGQGGMLLYWGSSTGQHFRHPSLLAHILGQSSVALDFPVPPAVSQGRQDQGRSCTLDFHSSAHVY